MIRLGGGRGILRGLAVVLLAVASAHLVLVLLGSGYAVRLGPLRVSVHEFRSTLLVFLAAAALFALVPRGPEPALARLRSASLFVLVLGLLFVYNLNGRPTWADDAIPARLLPLSLVREADFDLDEFTFPGGGKLPYYVQRVGDHVVSTYPPWVGVLAVPVYLIPILGGLSADSAQLPDLEKLAASLLVALSAAVLVAALRYLTSARIAWALGLVYALATSSFSTSSQALWQHAAGQLFVCLGLYALLRSRQEPRWAGWAALPLALAAICRPIDALFLLGALVYVTRQRTAQLPLFAWAAVPAVGAWLAYNRHYFTSPFMTGVASTVVGPSSLDRLAALFRTPLREGLPGVLLSPGRGLFVYSPILLLSLVGIVQAWRERGRLLLKYLSPTVVAFVLVTAKWQMWWGGWSYGPRLLADLTPLLCLYAVIPFEKWHHRAAFRWAAATLAVLSIGLHALGAFGDGTWNGTPVDVDLHPERLWSWPESPPVYYLGRCLPARKPPPAGVSMTPSG